jgi:hypothetical protein
MTTLRLVVVRSAQVAFARITMSPLTPSADQPISPVATWWAMLPTQATSSCPSRKDRRHDRHVGQVAGTEPRSLVNATSPGFHSRGAFQWRKCWSVRPSVMLNDGMPTVFSATARPLAS